MSEDSVRQRQEIPTHLEVEDRILFGLTLRQGILLLLGAAIGYFTFAQSGQIPWFGAGNAGTIGSAGHITANLQLSLPLVLRIALALFPLLTALALAVIQPAGRPLEDWLFAVARYLTLPKRCIWRAHVPQTIASGPSMEETMTPTRALEEEEMHQPRYPSAALTTVSQSVSARHTTQDAVLSGKGDRL